MNYLETAHRNIAWFNDRHLDQSLDMKPPFQRNPVWTDAQKSYLIDTVLRGLPIPELYMQDLVDENGHQRYVVVDGQQRIRSCLDFIAGRFSLSLDERDSSSWANLSFEELSGDQKKKIFGYKFVVRTLPDLDEPALREIFQRLNRNVVALNQQELRHATYWGPFIKLVEEEAEDNSFWSNSSLFTAQDIRRMLDVEFVSELVIGHLHGPQEKKIKLDHYYQLYEQNFEDAHRIRATFRATTLELLAVLPELRSTRWTKKSDFYTLFLVLARHANLFPLSKGGRHHLHKLFIEFGELVDAAVRLETEEEQATFPPEVLIYARAVIRAATDLQNRKHRDEVLNAKVVGILTRQAVAGAA